MRAHPRITGTGAVSCAGRGRRALWDAVALGKVCTAAPARVALSGEVGEVDLSALDGVVPEHPSPAARFLAAAMAEALDQAGALPGRVGLFVGSAPGPVLDLVPGLAAITGPIVLIGPGDAAGNLALASGANAIAAGEVDVAVCAAVAELAAPAGRELPAEGAGVLVLEHPEHLDARGGSPLAVLTGHATGADPHHATRPRPFHDALVSTIRGAAVKGVDWVCAPTGAPVETTAIAHAFRAATPAMSTTRSAIGHAGTAAGALAAVVATSALVTGVVPDGGALDSPRPVRRVLVPAYGLSGAVCTIALATPHG
ncbi:hypothetical protein ACOBQX_01405 [Actinokineospora sp. G85]|uniref:hypothetical protein n=1 Tax=Actinokineospora sp. G85 TaxID=3406626 RepID=UPI003C793158